jgi:hypothetical protein
MKERKQVLISNASGQRAVRSHSDETTARSNGVHLYEVLARSGQDLACAHRPVRHFTRRDDSLPASVSTSVHRA